MTDWTDNYSEIQSSGKLIRAYSYRYKMQIVKSRDSHHTILIHIMPRPGILMQKVRFRPKFDFDEFCVITIV